MLKKEELLSAIEGQVLNGLPGKKAQFILNPVKKDKYLNAPKEHRKAGVLFLLYPKNNEWHTCYIKRSSRDIRDKHAGQIGLPGGKVEQSDPDYSYTSLRETQEEVGVDLRDIQLVTPLTSLYVFASNFMVYPHVGMIDYTPTFVKQEAEVDDIVEISLRYLVEEMETKVKDIEVQAYKLPNVPYYDLDGHVLWGATSMITSEFLEIIRPISF